MNKSIEDKLMILGYCDDDLKEKILTFPKHIIQTIDLSELFRLLEIAPHKEVRIRMLQSDDGSKNILNNRNKEELDIILPQIMHNPQILKRLLTTGDWLPIATCDNDAIMTLLDASPDDETLKKQLLTYSWYKQGYPIERLETYNEQFTLLAKSPDEETLQRQLDMEINCPHLYETFSYSIPYKGTLNIDRYLSLLTDILKTNKAKKNLLLADWDIILYENNTGGKIRNKRKSNVAKRINELIRDFSQPNDYDVKKERLMEIVLEVIQDDSTTKEEALKLIRRYIEFAGPETKLALERIESYLTQ